MSAAIKFDADLAPPSSKWMGMQILEQDTKRQYSKVSFSPNKDMVNFGGVIQGGILTAMMDDAMGFNAFVSLGMKQAMVSIDLHTHFMKAVEFGDITVEAWVTRAGKSVVFLEAKLYDKFGDLSARATSSSKLLPLEGIQRASAKTEQTSKVSA